MIKVYQQIDSPTQGDCFKCAICSLLELDYDVVPNFIEYGDDWLEMTCNFFRNLGYEFSANCLWNPNVYYLEQPTADCFGLTGIDGSHCLDAIKPEDGIGGAFLACVYSPKYTTADEHPMNHLHSVLCDKDFNIIHDPQKAYEGIVMYPYSILIGYNGIRNIDTVRKI